MKHEPNQHYSELNVTNGLNPFAYGGCAPASRKQMYASSFENDTARVSAVELENFSLLEVLSDIAYNVLPVEYSIAHARMLNQMGARAPIRICDLESDDPDRSVFAYINGHRDIRMLDTPYKLVRYMRDMAKIREFPNYDTIPMPKVKELWNIDVFHLNYLLQKELGIPEQSMAGRLIHWLSHLLISRKIGAENVSIKMTEGHQKKWNDWMKAADLYLKHFSKNN